MSAFMRAITFSCKAELLQLCKQAAPLWLAAPYPLESLKFAKANNAGIRHAYSTNVDASTPHSIKSQKIAPTPISRGVALLVSRDQFSRDKLISDMGVLANEFIVNVSSYSSTEVAAFCEICQKLDYCTPALQSTVLGKVEGYIESFPADELSSIIWVLSKGTISKQVMHAVCNAISNNLDDLNHEDFPPLLHSLGRLSCTDPFLLTAFTETVVLRVKEFSTTELVDLISAYCHIGREFYDALTLNKLVDVLLAGGAATSNQLQQVSNMFDKVGHKSEQLSRKLKA